MIPGAQASRPQWPECGQDARALERSNSPKRAEGVRFGARLRRDGCLWCVERQHRTDASPIARLSFALTVEYCDTCDCDCQPVDQHRLIGKRAMRGTIVDVACMRSQATES